MDGYQLKTCPTTIILASPEDLLLFHAGIYSISKRSWRYQHSIGHVTQTTQKTIKEEVSGLLVSYLLYLLSFCLIFLAS